jgi:fumarate hydratase subunit beta
MIRLEIPIPEAKIRELKVGDTVLLTGIVVTARDAGHKLMVEERPQFLDDLLREGVIYHCGPVVKKEGERWTFVAAGPTTSAREEPYQAKVIESYGVRGVIGKGGMGEATLEACRRFGAVYFHAVGGCGTSIAQSVKEVVAVHKLEAREQHPRAGARGLEEGLRGADEGVATPCGKSRTTGPAGCTAAGPARSPVRPARRPGGPRPSRRSPAAPPA